MSAVHYTYRAEWSPDDEEYVGLVAEFPSLSWLAPNAAEAIMGIEKLAAEVIDDMTASGEPIPVPLTERRYSGKIALRTSPDLHRRLTVEAAEQGVSVNQWIGQKLAAPMPTGAASHLVVGDHVWIPASSWSVVNGVRDNISVVNRAGHPVEIQVRAYRDALSRASEALIELEGFSLEDWVECAEKAEKKDRV